MNRRDVDVCGPKPFRLERRSGTLNSVRLLKRRLILALAMLTPVAAAVACGAFDPGGESSSGNVLDASPGTLDASDSRDAGEPPDVGVPPLKPCAAPHAFCDDFERPSNVLGGKWSDFDGVADGGVEIALTPGAGFEGTTGLVVRASSPPGSPNARRRVQFSVPLPNDPVKAARLSFRVRIEDAQLGDASFVALSTLYFGSFPQGSPGNSLELTPSSARVGFTGLLPEAGLATQRFNASALDGQWHSVSCETHFDTDVVGVEIDGAPAAVIPPSRVLDYQYKTLTIYLGLFWGATSIQQVVAHFDDVVLDLDSSP